MLEKEKKNSEETAMEHGKEKRMKSLPRRFEVLLDESVNHSNGCTIVRDTQTGVQYLFVSQASKGGLTVLLNSEGKPLIE
jgi:hypothetical protein